MHNRRSIRLRGRDYSADGAYFVTVCTYRRTHLFGEIVDGVMCANAFGTIAADTWQWLSSQYPHVILDEWCVMPNHLHGILIFRTTAPTAIKPLGRLIGAFKTVSTKHINILRKTPGAVVWQRNFWEHIVRDETGMDRIRLYIRQNSRTTT